jgi:membrane-associated phospholipid phosphatase
VNPFDASILHFLNMFAQHSWVFDRTVVLLEANMLFKGVLAMSVFWWLWFRDANGPSQQRSILLFGLIASNVGIVVARMMAHFLPFRERPLHNPSLHFQLPFAADPTALIGWSSFPSDHATLFFGLAFTFFCVSRPLGIAAFAYVCIVICLPRLYLGYHYPTDILAGALLGIGLVSLGRVQRVRYTVTSPFFRWLKKSPSSFYLCLFFFSFSLAQQFEDLRSLAKVVLQFAKLAAGHFGHR